MSDIKVLSKSDLPEELLRTLRHMLGIDNPRESKYPKPYRDYFCAEPNCKEMLELEKLGLVKHYKSDEYYRYYTTTKQGYYIAMTSYKPKTKKKRIYLRYLSCKDTNNDLTFKEFLCSEEYREARKDI